MVHYTFKHMSTIIKLPQYVTVDCLKITDDKSSDNRVHALGARIIKATRAELRRRARSPRLNTTAMPRCKNQSPSLSTTSVLRHRAWSSRLTREAQHRVWSSCFNTTAAHKREAQDPRLRHEAWHRVWSSRFNTTATPKREAQDPHPVLPQRLKVELKPAFQLERSSASQL